MRIKVLVFFVVVAFVLQVSAHAYARHLFVVKRDYESRTTGEKMIIGLEWKELAERFPDLVHGSLQIVDLNFGKQVAPYVVDRDGDQVPDLVAFDFEFASNEPIYSFEITSSDEPLKVVSGEVRLDSRLIVTFLKSYDEFVKVKGEQPLADRIVGSTLSFYPNPSLLSINAPGQWNYEYGFFLNAALLQWQRNKNDQYYRYIKNWADQFITASGAMDPKQHKTEEYKLDDILPGRLFISLYTITKEEKYKHAADELRDQLRQQPRTSEGGYWHKKIYPFQMWLDGIYMADVFSTQYAITFREPELLNEAIRQILLLSKHTRDPITGLMYHGWDESRNKVWAHPDKGTSPEFWGRAMGWYAMALVECLDYIPATHPQRQEVITIFQQLAKSILRYQDRNTGLWYQVVDKGAVPGNWIETSCSSMFAYALAKGAHAGIIEKSYADAAATAFGAIKKNYLFFDDAGRLYLDGTVKVGTLNPKTSKGDFAYYIGTERRINDYKGLGAFLYASLEIEK